MNVHKKLIFFLLFGWGEERKLLSSQNLKEQVSPAREIPGKSWGCSGAAGRSAGPLAALTWL